ncbi:VC2046/SO_2500 family protein [Vibrio viridaestus]|uniref:Queuosine biosynthesis protein QueD n=1 Tax=Vibrio viridaestus TaxID=2487322 RepID=A0A3N9TK37_9VIBR|nr:VC2046/SO_2500 family protein [Vibrio viridaestus]RQW64173.1 hypothetical protein EES38_06175 [Vibrio viridaestus]
MKEIDLISANLINEIQCGSNVNQAISSNRRADFALLLAMLSSDARESTPVEVVTQTETNDAVLAKQFGIRDRQPLTSSQDSYSNSANIAQQFHEAGISSAKLKHYLTPEPLCYQPENTLGLPEDLYHNLSGHVIRQMKHQTSRQNLDMNLYHQLVDARVKDQLAVHA